MPEPRENIFVFVVCGDDKHITTLNFSLLYLKRFSTHKILVVTDLKRNKLKIEHDYIIDIHTPEAFTHHQASIWLKTGLHRHLPFPASYCYLDSDVIAVNDEVNNIFRHKTGPVTFAPDHCTLDMFGPSALNCGCMPGQIDRTGEYEARMQLLNDALHQIFPAPERLSPRLEAEKNKVLNRLHQIYRRPFSDPLVSFGFLLKRFLLPVPVVKLENARYDKKTRVWTDPAGNAFLYDFKHYAGMLEQKGIFRFDYKRKCWIMADGSEIFPESEFSGCPHIVNAIFNKFGIRIADQKWQHWNGGVFLFDEKSYDFLDCWHRMTMEVFSDPYWKVRDQATLAASVWKFGIQEQAMLPVTFNYIADYYNPSLQFTAGKGFSTDGFTSCVKPCFIHVYHHFGHKGWYIWDEIEKILPG